MLAERRAQLSKERREARRGLRDNDVARQMRAERRADLNKERREARTELQTYRSA